MTNFIYFIIRHLKNSLPVIALGAVLAALILAVYYLYFKRKYRGEKKFPWQKAVVFLIFAGYMGILITTTLMGRSPGYGQYANFYLFRAWRDAWNSFSQQSWLNVLINVFMFMPMGICLPLLSRKLGKWYWTLLIGFGVSGIIETVQYYTGIGIMDVDDLFCNALGALLGGCAVLAILSLKDCGQNRWRKFSAYIAVPVVFLLAVSGMFARYHFKEYGNLILAPSYRVNTSDISWKLSCELSDEEGMAAVYKAPSITKKNSDKFAQEFFEARGRRMGHINYFDSAATYHDADSDGLLYVNYIDGSYIYEYCGKAYGTDETDFTEEQVLKALKEFDPDIPEQTEFMRDDYGNYMFVAHQLLKDGVMYDGSLSCELDKEGQVKKLYQFLIHYTEYSEVPICSEQQAWEKLQKGQFTGPEWFHGNEPDFYEITGCNIEYCVDSKGFYRPVYVFDALVEGQPVGRGLLVPAD